MNKPGWYKKAKRKWYRLRLRSWKYSNGFLYLGPREASFKQPYHFSTTNMSDHFSAGHERAFWACRVLSREDRSSYCFHTTQDEFNKKIPEL